MQICWNIRLGLEHTQLPTKQIKCVKVAIIQSMAMTGGPPLEKLLDHAEGGVIHNNYAGNVFHEICKQNDDMQTHSRLPFVD